MKTIIHLLTDENNSLFGSFWKDGFEMFYIHVHHGCDVTVSC